MRARSGVGGFAALLGSALLVLACVGTPEEKRPGDAASAPPDLAPGRPAHLILVSVAGLTAERTLQESGGMPTLLAAGQGGVVAERVVSVAPAQVYPVHATLLTGVPPAVHGIPSDRLLGDRGVRPDLHQHASRLKVPALWQPVLERPGLVASLDWPTTVGSAIPLLLPDVTPVRAGETWPELLSGTASPWMLGRALKSDARAAFPGPQRDRFLVDTTCTLIRQDTRPSLVLLRLSQTEGALRVRGPWSDAAQVAFGRMDQELGRLARCVAEAGRTPDTALVVVGDRVITPIHSVVRANRVLAEAGLIRVGRTGTFDRWSAVVRSNGTSAFVYARDEGAAVRAREALLAAGERTGGYRVASAQVMMSRGADREAWFGLEAEPGFAFVDDVGGPLVGVAPVRAAGGALRPAGPESPAFVAWGKGLRRGLRVAEVRQADVAPTLARLLDLPLPDAQGRALVGLLRLGTPAAERR